jgi:hypothetical protein
VLWATRRSRWPGSNLMRAEQEPEPRDGLALVLFRAGSRSSRSPEICSRLRRREREGHRAAAHPFQARPRLCGQLSHGGQEAGSDRAGWNRVCLTTVLGPFPTLHTLGVALTGTPRV